MGKYEAKKASAAIQAYNALVQASGSPSAIINAAQTLLKRPLGEKHFEQVKAEITRRENVGLVNVWNLSLDHNVANLKQRTFLYRNLQLAPAKVMTGAYLPEVETLNLRQDEVTFCSRVLPIVFNSDHIEFRYLQRTAALTPYESKTFAATMILGTIIANLNGAAVNGKGEVMALPVMLPDEKGMYLGFSCAYEEKDTFDPRLKIGGGRFERGGHNPHYFACGDGTNQPRLPSNPPASRACLSINTFISKNEMSSVQRVVGDKMQSIAEHIGKGDFIERFMVDYARGVLGGHSSFTKEYCKTANDVAAVMASNEWDTSATKSLKSLQSFRLNGRGNSAPSPSG